MPDHEELIYLDPDEEITAIIDRLRQAEARTIRLVVPKGALVLQSLVSLKLLKKEADELSKRIALVTQDSVGQRLAERAELTVYRKPKDATPVVEAPFVISEAEEIVTEESEAELLPEEKAPDGLNVLRYDQPDESESPEKVEATIAAKSLPTVALRALGRSNSNRFARFKKPLIVLAALAVIGGLAAFVFLEFFPRAVITLALATEPLEQAVTVRVSVDAKEVDLANALVPATRRDLEVQVEKEAPATGKKQVGDKASASIKLYNYWDSNSQTIAASTVFRASDGTLFVATETVIIPGATTTLNQGKIVATPGTVNTIVQAEIAGTEANGKTGTMTIPALPLVRQDKIYGETVNPSSGGTSREITIITQADLDTLKSATVDALNTEGKTKLEEGVTGRLLDGALEVTIKSAIASGAVGDEASKLTYTMTGNARALLIADDQLKLATVAILERSIPSGKTLILRDNDSLNTVAENLAYDAGTVDLRVTVKSQTALAVDVDQTAGTVIGLSLSDAESRLRGMTGIASVSIANRPRWITKLPSRPAQIEVVTIVSGE